MRNILLIIIGILSYKPLKRLFSAIWLVLSIVFLYILVQILDRLIT